MRAIVGVLAMLAIVSAASAQEAAVERGRELAQTWCATCHAIGDRAQPSALADAPPFQSLAARPDFSADMVRKALLLPHPVMPEFPVTPADISALAAYIGSLAPVSAPQQRTDLGRAPPLVLVGGTDMAARGQAIVERDCSPCHTVAGLAQSPVPDAPAFATLSQRYPVDFLAEALAEGIMVGHETVAMPQYRYEADEVGAIIAYLERIQQ